MSSRYTKNLCPFPFLRVSKFTQFFFVFTLITSLLLPFGSFGQCPYDGILKLSHKKPIWWSIPTCSEVLADSTFKVTFDSLHQHPENFTFKPIRREDGLFDVPFGAAYWFKFKIRNEDTLPIFEILGTYKKEIERTQLFVVREEGRIDSFAMLGSSLPYISHNTPSPTYFYSLIFEAHKTYTFYLFIDYRDLPLTTTILLGEPHNFYPIPLFHKMGFFTGLALTYACIALIMFFFNRKPLYFSYFIYTLGGTAYMASVSNMGYEFIWSSWRIFASISDDIMGMMTLIGFLFVTIFFFETPQYFRVFDKLFKGLIGLTLVTIFIGLCRKVLPLGLYYKMTLLWMPAVLLIVPIIFVVGVLSYLKFRKREALFFLLGFTSLLTTIVCVIIAEMGYGSNELKQWAHNILPCFTVFFEFTIMFLVLSFRLRDEWTSKKIKELELQQNLSEQRQRISRDLHDDVGSTLNSISVFSEIAKQQLRVSNPESLPLLDRIGDSSRDLVSTINDIVWAINPQNDKFENIALKMRLFAADLLMPKDVDVDFQADTPLNDVNLSLEQRKQFYLIFKEAINNVYKYADCSTLKVHLELCETDICMTIIDNGKGFDTAHPKQGNGLISMAERAKILRGSLEILSELEKGTTVTLRFPIN
jgi:signal transduction histidine kinase